MQPLRIAYLSAGSFTHVRAYIEYFKAAGHQVHWITFTQATIPVNVPTYDLSTGVNPHGSQLTKWRYLTIVPQLRKLVREIRPDILHGHYVTSGGLLASLAGFHPYVVSARGSDLIASMDSRLWRGLLRRVFAGAAVVHTVSQQLGGLARELGVCPERLCVLTQGIDTQMLRYAPLPAGEPVRLICTRHLRDVYDPALVVRACGLLAARGVRFVLTFAGAGPMQGELQRLVDERGLTGRTGFLGGYDNSQIGELLRSNHIYVSSSLWDGTSISLLEAMSSGIFPVVSRIPSNLDWLEHGRSALMFDCGDLEGLAACLAEAIASPDLRLAAMAANREVAEARADRCKNMAALEQLYRNVLQPLSA